MGLTNEQKALIVLGIGYYYMYYTPYETDYRSSRQEAGGLKEWNTDQGIDEESVLDSDAAALKKKAEMEDICVPIGEGENCW